MHQCFIEQLYGAAPGFRDGSGTIRGAPLPRSRVTTACLTVVTGLLSVWMVAALLLVGVLGVIFIPALIVPVLVIPLASLIVTELVSNATASIISRLLRSKKSIVWYPLQYCTKELQKKDDQDVNEKGDESLESNVPKTEIDESEGVVSSRGA